MSEPSLCCTSVTISTARHIHSVGAMCPTSYLMQFETEAGTVESIYVDALMRVAQLIMDFGPRRVRIHAVSEAEERAIRNFISAEMPGGITVQ